MHHQRSRQGDRSQHQPFSEKHTWHPRKRREDHNLFLSESGNGALAVVKKVQDMLRDGREPQEIAVLFRTNTGARIYLEKFMEYNLPFRMRDGLPNIYEHWIANDLFTYIRIANGNRSRKDFLQIINRPNRYISRDYLDSQTVTLEGLRQKCQGRDWMEDRIDRLEYDLSCIAKMKALCGD